MHTCRGFFFDYPALISMPMSRLPCIQRITVQIIVITCASRMQCDLAYKKMAPVCGLGKVPVGPKKEGTAYPIVSGSMMPHAQ